MKQQQTYSGFTLIELIVSITLFSIVMVSVITIFIFSSDMSAKIEINRLMQENTKNAVETIAEDIRDNGIIGVSPDSSSLSCSTFSSWVDSGDKLCTKSSEYFLGKHDDVTDDWIRVDPKVDCVELQDQCVLIRNDGLSKFPLTNSFMSFRDIQFYISGNDIQKVTVTFHAQPSVKKGVKADLIKQNELFFQTTISERLIDLQ